MFQKPESLKNDALRTNTRAAHRASFFSLDIPKKPFFVDKLPALEMVTELIGLKFINVA